MINPVNDERTIEEKKDDQTWKSCCFIIDRRFCQFISQYIIILIIITVCIYQLIRLEDCVHQNLYVGLITFLIGIILPSPKISK